MMFPSRERHLLQKVYCRRCLKELWNLRGQKRLQKMKSLIVQFHRMRRRLHWMKVQVQESTNLKPDVRREIKGKDYLRIKRKLASVMLSLGKLKFLDLHPLKENLRQRRNKL